MRVAVVGSRSFDDYGRLCQFLETYFFRYHETRPNEWLISQVISGGAQGADHLAERFAKDEKIELVVFPAEWDKYGRSAGPRRNDDIVKACDVAVIFWDLKSPGSKDILNKVLKAGKPAMVVPI